jgi:hypothetical protein
MLADVYMQDCCAFPVPGNGEPAYDSAFRVPENGEPTRVLVPGNPEPICVPRSQERNPKLTPLRLPVFLPRHRVTAASAV